MQYSVLNEFRSSPSNATTAALNRTAPAPKSRPTRTSQSGKI